jgi:hypothetical protein
VTILDRQSAQITINAAGSFSKLQVTAHPVRLPGSDLSQDVKKSLTTNDPSIIISGLKPGTTYLFRAKPWLMTAVNRRQSGRFNSANPQR